MGERRFYTPKVASSILAVPIFKIIFMIRTANANDIKEIIGISDEVFGNNYYQPEKIILDSDSHIAIVSETESIVSGFGLARVLNTSEIQLAFEHHVIDDVQSIFDCDSVGLIKTLGVKRSFQGLGLGVRLFAEMENRLRSKGAERFIVPAWKDEKGIPVEKILKKFNYESFLEIPLFWNAQCDSGSYQCTSRQNECVCSAVFYRDTYIV